jgi:hypothetical protein
VTRPKRSTPVRAKISFSASTDEQAGMPVRSLIAAQRP